MSKHNRPRKGALSYNPRKRANSQVPHINYWAPRAEPTLLGFAGYKAGMTTISFVDDSNSPSKNNEIFTGATILEVPPIVVYGIRAYKDGQISADQICTDQKILKELNIKKLEKKHDIKSETSDDIFVLVYTRPYMCGFGKKHIEQMMIGLGGKDVAQKLEYAKSILGKELKASDIFKPGEYVDTIAVTKGKGWQGAVKRFGISTQRRKSTGKRRHLGNMGAFGAHGVHHTVPMAGQMGYHNRYNINQRIMKIATPEEVNCKGGFMHYGIAKNECLIVKGSISGPVKRLVRMRKAVRKSEIKTPDLRFISLESKQ
ncbi:MAG: 50S ribosomal protein L3 [Candidatus Micrarchaeia archaeon]